MVHPIKKGVHMLKMTLYMIMMVNSKEKLKRKIKDHAEHGY